MIKKTIDNIKLQLGWQGIAGVILLLFAAEFNFAALKPLQDETAFLHGRIETARSKSTKQGRNFSMGNRQKELSEFYDSLPEEKDVTDILAKIYSIAESSGLQFQEATYHVEEKDKSHVEYSMNFPIRGEYAKIREFVFRVLAKYPAIALDQINFQRDKVNDVTLKTVIKLTLFLRQ